MPTTEQIKTQNEIIANMEEMASGVWEELDLHITINGGLSIGELIKTIHFHKFTKGSLLYLINQINTNRCTFNNIGPFVERDGGWYNIRERQIDIIKKLTDENNRLKMDIEKCKSDTANALNCASSQA